MMIIIMMMIIHILILIVILIIIICVSNHTTILCLASLRIESHHAAASHLLTSRGRITVISKCAILWHVAPSDVAPY